MQYTIPEINNGVAKVQWGDGTWTFVELTSDMTEADLDDLVYRATPPHLKTGSSPSFLSAGASRTAAESLLLQTRGQLGLLLVKRRMVLCLRKLSTLQKMA